MFSSSKQASSKRQAASRQQHARNGETSELHCGALCLVEIWVHDSYECDVQSHKVWVTNSKVATNNGICKWRTCPSKSVTNGQKMRFLGQFGCRGYA